MVRAILIDPVERVVCETAVPDLWTDMRRKFQTDKFVRVATLPAGDGVYVAEEAKDSPAGFRLGHSKTFAGRGLVLGKRGQFGLLCDAVTDSDDIAFLLEFTPQ